MSRWRIAVVVGLLAVPALVLVGLGAYQLWHSGYGFWVWWPMSSCLALGYFLAWYWLRQKQLVSPADVPPPIHWTGRDHAAWKLVEERARKVAAQKATKFHEFQFYLTVAQDMALELAHFYHPGAKDPYSSLTVPEVLAVIELSSHDLNKMMKETVPGSHLLTISDWRRASEIAVTATDWYRKASNLMWIASAVLSPIETATRYAASQVGMAKPMQLFQQDLIAWFHIAYVERLGAYLIDLNSGRLRVGAERYRELKETTEVKDHDGAPVPQAPVERGQQVTLTILGQTKMGKSSFINALLGEQRARVDVVPATGAVSRYELPMPDISSRLILLDTVGYAHAGPKQDQLKETLEAARQSDLLVLMLHARNPARQADLELLRQMKEWFASKPDLKMPAVLAVVTHIDLLSPAMEWAPPYDWQHPKRPKETSIQEALTEVRDELGDYLVGVVPVCTAAGKVYGIEEWFLPTMYQLLGDAKSVAMLRCLRAEADSDKVGKVIKQVLNAGELVFKFWLNGKKK